MREAAARADFEMESDPIGRFDCDLLVVGLGPAGDVLAALAKLHGLSVIAIDREPAIYPLPRAAVFDHEIMRIFQMIGMSGRIAPLCRAPDRYQFVTAAGEVLLDFPLSPRGPFGWAEFYALHQPAVEQALRDRLCELGVDMRLGCRFLGLTEDALGVTVSVGNAGCEDTGVIRARYVAGCDGAASAVREAVGIDLYDYAFDEPWLVLDTTIDQPGDLPRVCQQICDPRRPVTHMAMSGARFRWEFMLKPGESAEDFLDDRRIRALVAPWGCADRMTIERKAVYRFHGLVAARWRAGRVFLAGDAAHQMPPFAGQGMCSGIRDAANLAWKLAAVLNGAGDGVLDSYQTEREPHARAIIETAIAMGRVVCLLDPDAAAARDAAMLERKRSGAQDVSMRYPDLHGGLLGDTKYAGALFPQPVAGEARLDDLLGLAPALIGRRLPDCPLPVRRLDLNDPALAPFAAALAAWLGEAAAPAVLVRPDRHIFAIGEPGALLAQWAEALSAQAVHLPAPA
jgi:3-(3-hydroxy-phenyl)propionate hydroxylase